MVSVRVGSLVSVKADKSFRSGPIRMKFSIPTERHLFDTNGGVSGIDPHQTENWVATMSPPFNRRGKMFEKGSATERNNSLEVQLSRPAKSLLVSVSAMNSQQFKPLVQVLKNALGGS